MEITDDQPWPVGKRGPGRLWRVGSRPSLYRTNKDGCELFVWQPSPASADRLYRPATWVQLADASEFALGEAATARDIEQALGRLPAFAPSGSISGPPTAVIRTLCLVSHLVFGRRLAVISPRQRDIAQAAVRVEEQQ